MTNIELYGTRSVPTIPRDISDARIKLLKDNMRSIIESGMMSEESYRITKILQAIEFWKQMSEGEENHG